MSVARLMPDWLLRRATVVGDTPAVRSGDDLALTFADLHQQATDMAQRLHGLGIVQGTRVAVLMHNSPTFVVLIHALIKLGAVLVPLNTRLTAAEIAWQIGDVHAQLLLHDLRNAHLAAEASSALPAVLRVCTTHGADVVALADLKPHAFPQRDQLDLAATHSIIYTSGTTGTPKGVLLSYGNHWWNALGSALNLGTHTDDCWLAVLPLFHVGGLAIVLRSVIYGVPLLVHERFDAQAVNEVIDRDGVTLVSLVANMLTRMLDARADKPFPSTLRAVLLGGGPAPLPLLERCAQLGVPVVQTYGMTETASQAATLPPVDALRKLGSVGKPLMHLDLRIEHEGVEAPPGVAGQIVVRGPSVTSGYAERPDATAKSIRDGWLQTGDIGYVDADGYLYVLDRRDDLIISGGENVYPAEVEAALLAHPAVVEAGVVGLPNPRWGQRVVAAVVVQPDARVTADELISFCGTRLARYKLPTTIHFLPTLPRNAAGKLLRRTLRDTYAGGNT